MVRRVALTRSLALLPLMPIVVGLVLELANPLEWSPVGGDFSVLELQLRGVARFQHWLGPYSRFGWSHPGPLYYWFMLPLYLVSGGSTLSMHVSAGLITLAAAAGAAVAFFRERTATLDRVAFVAALSGFALDLFSLRLPTNPWNPVVTVLPFAFYWITCLQLAAGRLRALPLAVLLHAFLAQTHVSYFPCTSALMAVSLAFGASTARAQGLPLARRLVVAAIVLVAAWLPTMIAELLPGKSNLAALLSHFLGPGSKPNSKGFVLTYGSTHIHALLSNLPGVLEDTRTSLALELVALQSVLLVVGGVVAHSQKDRFARAACVLSGVGIVVCFWSCRHIGAVSKQHEYLTHWFAVVGMFSWLAISLALGKTIGRFFRSEGATWVVFFVVSAGLIVATATTTADEWRRYRGTPASAARRAARKQTLLAQTDRVEALLRADPACVLSVGEDRPWGELAGVLVGLEKRGLAPILDRRWRFMFGASQVYGRRGGQTRALILSHQKVHSSALIESFTPTSHLYYELPPRAPHPSEVVRPVGFSGLSGDTRLISDGSVPPEGSRNFVRRSVRFDRDEAFLTVGLPEMWDASFRVAGLRVAADAGDQYEISGSYDGESFVPIGVLPRARGRGLRTRDFWFNDGRSWSAVRLSPSMAGRRSSIAELSPIIEEGTRIDLDRAELDVTSGGPKDSAAPPGLVSADAHPRLSISMQAGVPARLALRVDSVTPLPSAAVDVRFNGSVVGRLSLTGALALGSLVLPGAMVKANNHLEVEPASNGPKPRAILRSIELTAIGGYGPLDLSALVHHRIRHQLPVGYGVA